MNTIYAPGTLLLAVALLTPDVAAVAPRLTTGDEISAASGLGVGHSWIMAHFDERPNQMLGLSDVERTTLAAFHALTGGADVLTAAGLDRITAAAEENARAAYSRTLANMDLNDDGRVSKAEARSAVWATPSRYNKGYRIRSIMEADRDQDGMIDLDEGRRAAQKSAALIKSNAKAAYALMSLDSNTDGEVSAKEIAAATEQVFALVDTNKDGFSDATEICIARGPLIDRRGLRFSIKTCF